MSEKLPYEDELNKRFGDLPLPDTDKSWKKMEAMLDEDKERRGLIPFFLKNAIWMLLAVCLAGAGWYFIAGNIKKEDAIVVKKIQPKTGEKEQAGNEQNAIPKEAQLPKDDYTNKTDGVAKPQTGDKGSSFVKRTPASGETKNEVATRNSKKQDILNVTTSSANKVVGPAKDHIPKDDIQNTSNQPGIEPGNKAIESILPLPLINNQTVDAGTLTETWQNEHRHQHYPNQQKNLISTVQTLCL